MIVCLQGGELPAIDLSSDTTQKVGSRTLTEVVCAALYGVALKPGREQGSLHAACASLRLEGRALWRDESGPGWLRPHLELIAQSKTWPFDPDSRDDAEGITLSHFAAAQRWLTKSRRLGFAHGLPSELAEKVIRLANMTDAEAIADAFTEADRIERAEGAVNDMSAEFYELLSESISTQRITLKAIPTDPRNNDALRPKTPSEPPHQTIHADNLELPWVHNLFDNDL